MKPDAVIDACRTSHRRLLEGLAVLTDADFRVPSSLPGYSRGHVVTHVASKVRAHIWIVGGPAAGEVRRLHPVGYDADLAADAGAGRSASELCADLADSFEDLESAWDHLDEDQWDREAIMVAGPRTMVEVVGHHLRNVEVHHVDLDIGYHVSDWPSILVEGELTKRLRSLPDRADHAELLAWLIGRAPAPELAGPW